MDPHHLGVALRSGLKSDFGIYFNVSDRLMGTNHPAYEERFAEVVAPAKAT